MDEHIVSSLAEYVRFLEATCKAENTLFRGQPEDLTLLPKIARPTLKLKYDLPHAEVEMLEEFERRSFPYLDRKTENKWDLLALAQHHGLPTRLLDWTKNPLAALWFAVENPPEGQKYGVVWAFEARPKDFASISKGDPFEQTSTKVFQPNHITRRIVAQSGWFTVHPYRNKTKRFWALEKVRRYRSRMIKAKIRSEYFFEIRYQLDRCGINRSVLFPDMDGLCKQITWLKTLLPDEGS